MNRQSHERRVGKSKEPSDRAAAQSNSVNTIGWNDWDDEPFRVAKKQDKPILLTIGAAWCHWCHVMDETTYSDDQVIELINQNFVPIRVDTDRHPEVDDRYNMGGWPSVAILTPSGDVLSGATYLPAQSMISLLDRSLDFYRKHSHEIDERVLSMQRQREAQLALDTRPGVLDVSIVQNVVLAVSKSFDPRHGGFGKDPKFPLTMVLDLLMQQYRYTGDAALRQIVTKTLDEMSQGEIFDREEGGFFRYATKRDWGTPHYEKKLDDNADLLRVYLHAYQLTGEPAYRDIAGKIVGYLSRVLYDPKRGAFRGSQDADEVYYQLTAAQRAKVSPPRIDPAIYTDWNANAASAYIQASYILNEPGLGEIGRTVLEFLWQHSYSADQGMAHYYYRAPKVYGWLPDQVWMAKALMDAYESLGEPAFLERAESLARIIEDRFLDADGTGFFSTSEKASQLAALRYREKAIQENALAADEFLRLSQLTGNQAYRMLSTAALKAFVNSYLTKGFEATVYAAAVWRALRPPVHVIVVGQPGDELARQLHIAALGQFVPARTVQLLSPSRDSRRLSDLGYPSDPAPMAYVCEDGRCAPSANQPTALIQSMEQLIGP